MPCVNEDSFVSFCLFWWWCWNHTWTARHSRQVSELSLSHTLAYYCLYPNIHLYLTLTWLTFADPLKLLWYKILSFFLFRTRVVSLTCAYQMHALDTALDMMLTPVAFLDRGFLFACFCLSLEFPKSLMSMSLVPWTHCLMSLSFVRQFPVEPSQQLLPNAMGIFPLDPPHPICVLHMCSCMRQWAGLGSLHLQVYTTMCHFTWGLEFIFSVLEASFLSTEWPVGPLSTSLRCLWFSWTKKITLIWL